MNILLSILFVHCTFINISIQFEVESEQQKNSKLKQFQRQKILCGTVFTEQKFYLQSPKFPESFPQKVNCEYILKNPVECPTYFKFDFVNFHLENSVGCTKDKLIIQDQVALCGKGPENPKGNVYFSNNGSLYVRFISNGEGNFSGFKILVTRTDCVDAESAISTTAFTETFETSTLEPEVSTLPLLPYRPFNLPIVPSSGTDLPQCCINIYKSRRFLITSPNFPNTLSTKQECIFQIQKSNANICRLRLSFLFFYLGTSNYNNCPYGYLELDGKHICGCNKGLKLTTAFENSIFKNLVFKSYGTNLNSQSGFVIEVIQDECPNKYYPASPQSSNISQSNEYKFFVPNTNGQSYIEQAQLVHENTLTSYDSNSFSSKFINFPKLIKTFYFFAEPDYNALPIEPREREPTTFIDTSSLKSIVTNLNSFECANWNRVQLENLSNRYGRDLQTCGRTQDNTGEARSDCVELNYVNGFFKSPGYPFFYPKNLNICYRLRKQTGYCGVRLFMTDFQLQNSYGCHKDYILLESGNKYCGNRLLGQYLAFDLTTRNYADIMFVTNKFFCGRGFYSVYRQIPCQPGTDYPFDPPVTTTSPRPSFVCDRYISEQIFTFEVIQDVERCSFQIARLSKDTCKVNLYFEQFNLFCGSESLLLDNMNLCGNLTGRKISVNFENNGNLIQIIYRSSLTNKYGNFKLRISGEQISDDCLYPEPPVQRYMT